MVSVLVPWFTSSANFLFRPVNKSLPSECDSNRCNREKIQVTSNFEYFPSQQTHNVAGTSLQRRCKVSALQRHCNGVVGTLCICWAFHLFDLTVSGTVPFRLLYDKEEK